MQLGCYPVAVVILHVNKTWNWLLLNLIREDYMRSMYWQQNLGNHLNICFLAQGNQEKPVSNWPVAGPSKYWLLTSSPPSKVNKKQCPHTTTNTRTITAHTRQLQQYTRSTNKNYTKYNLKLTTKHKRKIRILQHVQKVKTPKQESIVYSFF